MYRRNEQFLKATQMQSCHGTKDRHPSDCGNTCHTNKPSNPCQCKDTCTFVSTTCVLTNLVTHVNAKTHVVETNVVIPVRVTFVKTEIHQKQSSMFYAI